MGIEKWIQICCRRARHSPMHLEQLLFSRQVSVILFDFSSTSLSALYVFSARKWVCLCGVIANPFLSAFASANIIWNQCAWMLVKFSDPFNTSSRFSHANAREALFVFLWKSMQRYVSLCELCGFISDGIGLKNALAPILMGFQLICLAIYQSAADKNALSRFAMG